MTTKKLIIILAIIVAVVVLLIVFVPKSKAFNPNNNGGESGTGGSGSGGGNNGTGGPSTGVKNYDASTFRVGENLGAEKDFYANCTSCILPNWLCLLNDCYEFKAGTPGDITFVSLVGSTVTFNYDGYTYTVLLGDMKPYVVR